MKAFEKYDAIADRELRRLVKQKHRRLVKSSMQAWLANLQDETFERLTPEELIESWIRMFAATLSDFPTVRGRRRGKA